MSIAAIVLAALQVWHGSASVIQPVTAADVAPALIVRVPSASLGRDVEATVLLPSRYERSARRYPVLYLLHGEDQDHTAFATRSWFHSLAARDIIVVTPHLRDTADRSRTADPMAGLDAFVVDDLVAFVDREFRTITSPAARAVAGVSRGAGAALTLGLKHSGLFGAAGAIGGPLTGSRHRPAGEASAARFGRPASGARGEQEPGALAAAIRPEAAPLLYIACGSDDPSIDDTREFLSLLASRSIPYEYRELSPVGRGWALWDGQIMEFVDVLARRWGHDAEESQR